MSAPFWKPKPKPPGEDWIAPWLRASLYVSTVGWIVYGVFALAFDDIGVISPVVQSWLVVAGSALIVTGAEMNTAPTVVAVARKWGRKRAQPLDAVAFTVSLIGSVTAGLIAFSVRQTLLGDTGWRALALNVGPLIVGIAIACDYYAGAIELGLLDADYEQDMERWLDEQQQWNDAHGIVERPAVHLPAVDGAPLEQDERQAAVLRALTAESPPSKAELARVLDVSPTTIRRDVRALADAGKLNGAGRH